MNGADAITAPHICKDFGLGFLRNPLPSLCRRRRELILWSKCCHGVSLNYARATAFRKILFVAIEKVSCCLYKAHLLTSDLGIQGAAQGIQFPGVQGLVGLEGNCAPYAPSIGFSKNNCLSNCLTNSELGR